MDTPLALTPQTGWLPAGDARDSGRDFRVAVPTVAGTRSGKSAGHFRLHALPGKTWEPCGAAATHAPDIHVPGKPGRGRPQPGRAPGDDGIAGTGNGRARTGAVCARDGRPRPGAMGKRPERRDLHAPSGRNAARTVNRSAIERLRHAWRTHFVSASP
jgi:hypothetical protein